MDVHRDDPIDFDVLAAAVEDFYVLRVQARHYLCLLAC